VTAEARPDRLGQVARVLFCAALVFVAFLLGCWVAWRDVFPFRDAVRNAFLGAQALLDERLEERNALQGTRIWRRPEEGQPIGVTVLDAGRASPGLTLVLVGEYAHLIELDGTVRHTWHLPYDAYRGPGSLVDPDDVSTSRFYWWRARVFPDGSLLAIVDLKGHAPEGLALIRVDRDSRLQWAFHGHVHHDFDVADDGTIYALGQGVRAEPPPEFSMLRGPMLDDRVFVISPEGVLLDDVPIFESFARSPYKDLVQRLAGDMRYDKGDYLHSNNLDIISPADAERFPLVRAGQLLISFREISTIAALDAPVRRITWALPGAWHHQHDPDFLEDGRILLFDNQGDWDRGGHTRVIEVDPLTGGVLWQYPGATGARLSSGIRGDQQRLPNGNTLINEQTRGRLLEVTREGETVWEYLCPFPLPGDEESGMLCNVMSAQRFAPGEIGFPLNGGTPGDPAARAAASTGKER